MLTEKKIIFAGGGGHALSLIEALPLRLSPFGYLSPVPAPAMEIPYLGDDCQAPEFVEKGFLFHIAFVYAGMPVMNKRRRLIELYRQMGADFASIVAESAIVTSNSSIGRGAAVLNGAIVNRACVGDHAIINSGAIVEHDCVVGSNSFIGPGATVGGAVTIGDDCFIGLGAKLRNGIEIASGVTIGMGAVVTRSLTEPGIYHGSPLRRHNLLNEK